MIEIITIATILYLFVGFVFAANRIERGELAKLRNSVGMMITWPKELREKND